MASYPTPERGNTAVSMRQNGDAIAAWCWKHFGKMLLTLLVGFAWQQIETKHAEAIGKIEEQKVEDAKQFEALRSEIRELQKNRSDLSERLARIETTNNQLLNEVKELRADLRRRDGIHGEVPVQNGNPLSLMLSNQPGIRWSLVEPDPEPLLELNWETLKPWAAK